VDQGGVTRTTHRTAADDFDMADTYGVLFDLDYSHEFLDAIGKAESVRMAFIVTDDDRSYQMVCSELPAHLEPVRCTRPT